MKPYSLDLREKVVTAYESGAGTQKEIAARFCVSLPWLKQLLRQKRISGSLSPKPHGGGRRAVYDGKRLDALKKALSEKPDATLEELLVMTRVSASIMAVHRALKRLGCRRKKNRSAPANRTTPTSKPGAKRGGWKWAGSTPRG
jgi:transposase